MAVVCPLGAAIPACTPHALSVSLPTWQDNVGYEEGDKRVTDVMTTGYPRFFVHHSVRKLATICEQKFGASNEQCLLFPSKKIADHCRSFMQERSLRSGSHVDVRLVHFLIYPEDKQSPVDPESKTKVPPVSTSIDLHIVLFPADAFSLGKEFWQHSGLGISSRMADHCLSMLPDDPRQPSSPTSGRPLCKPMNRHYSAKSSSHIRSPSGPVVHPTIIPPSNPEYTCPDALRRDECVYLEERYGRNLPLSSALSAKKALRCRIAGVLVHDSPDYSDARQDVEVGSSSRGISEVSESDVFLFSTGMAAIWSAHNLILAIRPEAKSVCFGFQYTDTMKALQKWGPGCHFFGHARDSDIDELQSILEGVNAPASPILALFTEIPSNPLLRSANLPRLRALADKHDFLIVIDETIGNFVNVEVLPYADVVVSSLSKIFSGDANVLGGSLVLNPAGRHYHVLKSHMSSSYEDTYFGEDAIYMERNSRNFRGRIKVIDSNTEAVCEFLRSRSVMGCGGAHAAIKEVFYPKWTCRENYERCRTKDGGFGGLFSLTFISDAASHAFFDALPCHKGPSLGTNFTLACPYTILGHYGELDWAAQYGVERGLVRVSVGMEDKGILLEEFGIALKAAEATITFST